MKIKISNYFHGLEVKIKVIETYKNIYGNVAVVSDKDFMKAFYLCRIPSCLCEKGENYGREGKIKGKLHQVIGSSNLMYLDKKYIKRKNF